MTPRGLGHHLVSPRINLGGRFYESWHPCRSYLHFVIPTFVNEPPSLFPRCQIHDFIMAKLSLSGIRARLQSSVCRDAGGF